jgi:hypothetical protein
MDYLSLSTSSVLTGLLKTLLVRSIVWYYQCAEHQEIDESNHQGIGTFHMLQNVKVYELGETNPGMAGGMMVLVIVVITFLVWFFFFSKREVKPPVGPGVADNVKPELEVSVKSVNTSGYAIKTGGTGALTLKKPHEMSTEEAEVSMITLNEDRVFCGGKYWLVFPKPSSSEGIREMFWPTTFHGNTTKSPLTSHPFNWDERYL